MSEIIDNARTLLNDYPSMRHSDITAVLDYAQQLEARYKRAIGCKDCAHHGVWKKDYPCNECIAARTYPNWKLAPLEGKK